MKLVTVIVPVYNIENFISECVESILSQTYKNLEIILVDDGSCDLSGKICDDYRKKDSRVKVIHKKNGGLSSARNVGIDISSGYYLFFVDGDDFLDQKAIESCVYDIEKNNSDLVLFDIGFCDEFSKSIIKDETKVSCKRIWTQDDFWFYFQNGMWLNCVVAWNKLYKKNLFSDIRFEEGRIHEDEFIIHKIVDKCNKFSYLSEKLYNYRQRPNSITSEKNIKSYMDYSLALIDRTNYFISKNYLIIALDTFRNLIVLFKTIKSKRINDKKYSEYSEATFLEIKVKLKFLYKSIQKTDISFKSKIKNFYLFYIKRHV